MSNKNASAKLLDKDETEMVVLELGEDVLEEAHSLLVGAPIKGEVYLTTHYCDYCRSEMETIGIAHGIFECSYCASVRSRRVEMKRRFKCLENE